MLTGCCAAFSLLSCTFVLAVILLHLSSNINAPVSTFSSVIPYLRRSVQLEPYIEPEFQFQPFNNEELRTQTKPTIQTYDNANALSESFSLLLSINLKHHSLPFITNMSPKMTVDVSLCGCIPRSEMASARLHHKNQTDHLIAMAASSLARKVSDDSLSSSSQDIQIPSWAVPARGECILEVRMLRRERNTYSVLSTLYI